MINSDWESLLGKAYGNGKEFEGVSLISGTVVSISSKNDDERESQLSFHFLRKLFISSIN